MCKTYIKSKKNGKVNYKKLSKLDKNYTKYVNLNTIIYTACNLFILLQMSVPPYSVKRVHVKCISLGGYRLIQIEILMELNIWDVF